MLRNGTHVHLDGASGNIVVNAAKYLQMEAHEQLDLFGRVVTIQGLPAVYPGGNTGLVSAPSTADGSIMVAHVTSNAAYNYIPPIAATGPNGEGIQTGWTYLAHAPASRVEIAPDGVLRTFAAPLGLVGEAIVWTEIPPTTGASPYIVPPPEPYNLTFACRGDQRILWVCPPTPDPYTIVFLDSTLRYVVANAIVTWTTGTYTLKKNFSTVTIPLNGANPLTVVEGDVLELVTAGTVEADGRLLLSLWGINALPDTASWWDVNPTTDPPTVTPPA
jgi:hypothetical protein